MRTVSYRIGDLNKAVIHIGRVAENEYTRVQIDAGEIYAEYPHAAAALTVQPPEGEAYPAVVTRDGDMVVWDVPDSALTAEGNGEIQLTFTSDEVVVKSAIGRISICRSIVGEGEAPDPLEDFLAEAGAALTAIPETIDAALQEAKDSGEFDGPAGPAGQDGQPGADGAPGADGFSPSASVTKSGSTATIVITDKDGTTTAQISDGSGANVIDDTAGAGDTDVTWSADKLTSEKSDVMSALSSKYEKPSGGIPSSDMASAVQTSLGKADTAYQLPSGGIPASDIADGVIPSVDPADIAQAVDDWLDENITNPDSPPLDRSLSSAFSASPADLVGDLKEEVDKTIAPVRTTIPNPRQLWDKSTEPFIVDNSLYINTSTKAISSNYKARAYTIEVNGSSGEQYTFNLLNSKTFSDFGVTQAEIFASNIIPVVNGTALQRGSTGASNYRASITLSQNSKYIIINLFGANYTDADDAKTHCDGFMDNVVVRKGTYDTTYYDYSEITKYTSNAVTYKEKTELYIGSNIVSGSSVGLGTNWTGDLANGFTHATGAEGELTITIPTTANVKYIVMFTTSSYSEANLFVIVGNEPKIDTYNGTSNVVVGIISDASGSVKINASSNYGTTITGLGIYPVKNDGTGTKTEIPAQNTDFGNKSALLSGFWNVAIGATSTQESNINGSRNVAIGHSSQNKLKQGTRNIGIGTFAMPFVKQGDRNVSIGSDSLYSTDHTNTDNQAYDNVAIGYASLHDGTMIQKNVSVGVRSMQYAESDSKENVSIGYNAGNYAHNYNTHIGMRAGYYTKGNGNVSVGCEAGSQLYVTGEHNVSIGMHSGFDNTGASSASPKTIDNSIAIGYNVKNTDSNQAMFGNSSQTIILAGKKINFNNDGTVTWETLS